MNPRAWMQRARIAAVAALALSAGVAAGAPPWLGLLLPPPAPPAAAAGASQQALLEAMVAHSRLPLPIERGRLGGTGGERWRSLAAASAHVVFGEQHGNQGIARVAQAMWADLADAGWRHAALETDPFVTAALERELRLGGPAGWARFLGLRGGAEAVPFVGWTDEVALAAAAPQLWGLDQVFIGSAGWLLRDLLDTPASGLDPDRRALVEGFAAEAGASRDWLGRVQPERLRRATPTGVQGLGGFVTEFAAARDEAVLSVLVLCGPGSQGAVHGATPQPCDGWLRDGDWQFLRPFVDESQPTLFDLRTWRLRPRRLQGLPVEVQRIAGAYDLLVFVPASPAAQAITP